MTSELLIHIGDLFYAIAKADKNLSFEEYIKLSDTLEKHWSFIGESGMTQIKAQFNTLQKNGASADESFDKFIAFLHQNSHQFDDDLKSLILKTANEIAYAFAKINKSELNLMARLSIEFKKS
ncbi:MAG: hypothetical protein AAFX55_19340 [Bacteroidota bacterium]